jgi:hypothetical protein
MGESHPQRVGRVAELNILVADDLDAVPRCWLDIADLQSDVDDNSIIRALAAEIGSSINAFE